MPTYPIVTQAGLVMPGASGYALPKASLKPIIKTPMEPWADYHWVFGSGNPTFVDLVQGAQLQRNFLLTLVGGAGYEANGTFTMSNGGSGVWFSTGGAISSAYVTSRGTLITADSPAMPTVTINTTQGSGGNITVSLAPAPTQNAKSIVTTGSSGVAAGLLTPIPDASSDTVCIVAKITTGSSMMVMGTLNSSGGYAGYGAAIFQGGSLSYSLTTRTKTADVLGAPAGAANGNFVFIGMSHKADGSRTAFIGGPTPVPIAALANQVKTLPSALPPLLHGIGNCYYPTFATQIEAVEYFHVPGYCTTADFADLYARCKNDRMSALGIALL